MTRTDAKTTSRVDLHCHSSASAVAKLGVQSALGLPECATPPEEVHALAKRRGMDFVTITDHDTIDGVLAIADRPDVFVSEELTVAFRGRAAAGPRALPRDHAGRPRVAPGAPRTTSRLVAAYLHEHEIACALAHPFFAVAAPLTARHRRRLAELFGIWEVRNGARDAELNAPAAIYVETHGGTGIGGTDDHAGIDIGRTWSETPFAATPAEFLAHVRAGAVQARGDQGSAARWAHNAMALAVRALGRGAAGAPPDPAAVLRMAERVMADADARGGGRERAARTRARPRARRRARGVLRRLARPAVELDRFARRRRPDRATCRPTASRTRTCTGAPGAATSASSAPRSARLAAAAGGLDEAALADAACELFAACVPAIPYAPAAAFLGREKRRLGRARRRAGAGRAARRRPRRDARRHAHARRDPRARRAGLRGRGDRHRPARRPPPARRRRARRPVLPRASASASRASPRSSTRSPRAATSCCTSARPGRSASRARPAGSCSACRSPARTTPS